ncbi:MAG: DUF342 domain-containing protein [Thermodesulfobacteria bacterium]|nr:DUF342 domain-containing protein [Thermodesulfobacteriota bacterium]
MGAISPKLKRGLPVLQGRFKLVVSPDGLKVYLVPQLPGEELSPDDLRQLKEILKEEGIVYGILDPPQEDGTSWLLARGKPPSPGRDGRVEFFVDLEHGPRKKGKRLDYREMNYLVCVSPGEVIARKIPPTPGKTGRDVFGQRIPAPKGRDTPLKLGQNVVFEEKTGRILAETAGVVRFEDGRLEVLPEFTLEGDVNWDVGNIHFKGRKLTITGQVKRGFKLRIEGDLEIQGSVEDEVEIEVVGDLVIQGLIHGRNLRIKGHKRASLGEVEYARLEIAEDLEVNEYLLQARATVGGNLMVTQGVGAIIGGEYFVRGNVTARVLGSGGQVKTLVRAGYDADKMQKLEEVAEKLVLVRQEKRPLVLSLKKGLELLRAGRLPPHKLRILEGTKERVRTLLEEEKRLVKEREEILSALRELERCRITALNRVFIGVTVGISRHTFTVTKPLGAGTFLLKGKQIFFDQTGSFTS